MSYVGIDDSFPDHPKFVGLELSAIGLWAWGQAYCSRHLTDGFIPSAAVQKAGKCTQRAPKALRVATELVRAGLWDAVDGGFRVRNFLKHNPSKATVEKKKKEAKARKEAWLERVRNGKGTRSESVPERVPDAFQNAFGTLTTTSTSPPTTPTTPVFKGSRSTERVPDNEPETEEEPVRDRRKPREREYAEAWQRGIRSGNGGNYVFPVSQQGRLNGMLPQLLPGLRDEALLHAIEKLARDFAAAVRGEEKFFGRLSPDGCIGWHNAGRPKTGERPSGVTRAHVSLVQPASPDSPWLRDDYDPQGAAQ